MESRAMIRFFTLKRLKAQDVRAELESWSGPEASARPTVKKWRRRFWQGIMDRFDDPTSGRPLMNDLGEAIVPMFAERPLSSCKMLCRHSQIRKKTCFRILHDRLG
jgi:hypothetical protein